MIEEKLQLRQRIIDIGIWVEIFFRTTTNKTTGIVEYYSYPKFQGVLEQIQTAFDVCLGHTLLIISDDVNLVDSCREEISVFYLSLLDRYYNNYKRELPRDVFEFDESAQSVKGSDLDKSTYKQNFFYNEYKVILFDMLMIYKTKFEEIFNKAISNAQFETHYEIEDKALTIKIAPNPLTFDEIFKSDWKKYIDVLKLVNPPILNEAMEFQLKRKGGNGVITSWIFALMNKQLFKPSYNLNQIIDVFNREIKDIKLGKNGRSAYETSQIYIDTYQSDLEKLL